MLSDSLFEATEEIWEAVKRYGYSDGHRKEISEAIESLLLVVWHHDRIAADRTPEKKRIGIDAIRQEINRRWDEIAAGERDIC